MKPLLLQVDLLHVRLGDQAPITLGLYRASTPSPSLHSATECPSATANCNSMATELQELFSQMVLDTSIPASGDTTPRRPTSVALGTPPSLGAEDPHVSWRGQFWLHPSWWLPPSRHHCEQTCLMIPSQASICPLQPWCWKLPRWPVSLPPCHPRHLLGLTWAPSLTKCSDYKRRWTEPWGDYLQPGYPSMPITESRFQTLKLPLVKMRPKLPKPLRRQGPLHNCNLKSQGYLQSSYQGGKGHLCRLCPHPTTITQQQ